MNLSKKALTIASLSAAVVLASLYASRDAIYFAFNHDQMVKSLNDKHLSKLLAAPTSGKDQEKIINQIRILKSGRWNRFISTEKAKLLDEKLTKLDEGIRRRILLSEIRVEDDAAASRSASLKKQLLEDKGKMKASITRYLRDAPSAVTEGEAIYNEKEGYLDFFDEIANGPYKGHRYNHRCYRDGSVSESDSIITKDSWEKEPDYLCSMDFGPSGLPVTVVVKSLMNNGFIVLRGTLYPRQTQPQVASKPEHCPVTMKQKRLIVDQLVAGQITAADGRSKFASIRTRLNQCYQSF